MSGSPARPENVLVKQLDWLAEWNGEVLGGNEEIARTLARSRAALGSLVARQQELEAKLAEKEASRVSAQAYREAAEARLAEAERERDKWCDEARRWKNHAALQDARVAEYDLSDMPTRDDVQARLRQTEEALRSLLAECEQLPMVMPRAMRFADAKVAARAALDAQPAEEKP